MEGQDIHDALAPVTPDRGGDRLDRLTVLLATRRHGRFETLLSRLTSDAAIDTHTVAAAGSADLARCLELWMPRVLLLDRSVFDGWEPRALQAIGEQFPTLRVLLLWDEAGHELVQTVLRHGFHGLLVESCSAELCAKAIRAVSRGELWMPRALLAQALSDLLRAPGCDAAELHCASADAADDTLTRRETQIVELLRQGLTNKEIARRLGIMEDTVKKHLQSVFGKLGVHRRALVMLRSSADAAPVAATNGSGKGAIIKLAARHLLLALLLCVVPELGSAQPASRQDEVKALRQEIDVLKQGQQRIGSDVAEIKRMLQAMQPPPPARPVDALLELGNAPVKGEKNAKLILIEFSDYQCPFCKRHVQTTLPQVEKSYIETGKLRYVFKDFPLAGIHPQAPKAAEAAHCAAEQGKYWQMHDRLFAEQQALAPENLADHAKGIGLAVEPFKICLDSGRYAATIRKDIAEAEKLGMTGTPTLFLGVADGDRVKLVRMLVGAQPFGLFKDEIDKLLAETSARK